MLILTRKRGEAVDIIDRASGNVLATVTVMQVVGSVVRLGFEAPRSVQILRDNAINRATENGNGSEEEG